MVSILRPCVPQFSFCSSTLLILHLAYAKKHNYTLAIDFRADVKVREIMWYKFIMVERLILEGKHDCQWLPFRITPS